MRPQMYGWVGRILRVDLTSGELTETPTSDYVPRFIGGRGIGAMVYWEEVPPDCTAFDPENRLIIMTGPVTGTLAPASSRFCVTHKSPVTTRECYTYSAPGGHWGPNLKFAGFDGIVIKGKASQPVYLWIHDGKAELRSADRLWGMTTRNTYLELALAHGQKTRALVIGPAGENLCREAVIQTDGNHATGLGGAGAVMGSKNLKAIAVCGSGVIKVARPKELIDLAWYYGRLVNRKPGEREFPAAVKSLSYYMYHRGHLSHCPGLPKVPSQPEVYFKNKGLDDPISLMSEPVKKGILKLKFAGCHACPVCCTVAWQSNDVDVPSGAGKCNGLASWPPYEWAEHKKVVGIPSIWYSQWVEDLGLSITNTCGYHFNWFFDLVKLGILTKENTGVPVDKPCSLEFIKGILQKVAYRQGIGDQLAEGQERFLKKIADEHPQARPIYEKHCARPGYFTYRGPLSSKMKSEGMLTLAAEVKEGHNKVTGGTGKAGHDLFVMTPEQQRAVLRRGNVKYFGSEDATDLPGEPKTWNNKVRTAIVCQNLSLLMDCVTMCGWANCPPLYSSYTEDKLGDAAQSARVFSAVTGIDMTYDEMVKAADPVFTLERCIQVREGRRREHDLFPDRAFAAKTMNWTNPQEFDKIMDEYYQARGWDTATAIPRKSTLAKLGLAKVADELEQNTA